MRKADKRQKYFALLALLMIGCHRPEGHRNRAREPIVRLSSDRDYEVEPASYRAPEPYPWEEAK